MSWRGVGVNAFYVMASTAAIALLQWAIMAVIARLDGPAMLGQYTLAQAFATPVSYLAWLAVRQQYLVSREDGATAEDFLLLRIVLPVLAFGAVLALVDWHYGSAVLFWICVGTFAVKYAEGFYDLVYGRLQQIGQTRAVAVTSIVRCVVSFALFAAIYWWIHDLATALGAVALLWLGMFAAQRRRLWPHVRLSGVFPLSPRRLRKLGRIIVDLSPFALSMAVMSFTTNAPRYLLDHFAGAEGLGFFAAAYHFVALGSVVVASLGHALLPDLSLAIRQGARAAFWKRLLVPALAILAAGLAGAALARVIGGAVMGLIYGRAFAAHGDLLVWAGLCGGPFLAASLLANGVHAAQLRRGLLGVQLSAFATLVAVTVLLAPAMGAPGAFIGILAGALVQGAASIALLLLSAFPDPPASGRGTSASGQPKAEAGADREFDPT